MSQVPQDQVNAALALLRADERLVVCDGRVPTGTVPPYVLVYVASADPEDAESRALAGRSERHVSRLYAHCVGANQAAARAVAARVRVAWLDITPTVPGRRCWPIRREDGQPAQSDEDVGQQRVDLVDVYRLESVPA